jgi:hypothetical protein
MQGSATRRFCEHCQLHVHNLSAMSATERENFLAESGGAKCIAYELRGDGSMVTQSHWSWIARPMRRVQFAAVAMLAALLPFLFSACATRRSLGKMAAGHDASCAAGKGETGARMLVGTPMPSSEKPKQ